MLSRYERVAFEKPLVSPQGQPLAAFICPGHPLLDATIDSPSYPVETFLGNEAVTDEAEKEEQSRTSDVFQLAVEKLGEYIRTQVSVLDAESPYSPNHNLWLSNQNPYKFYGNENYLYI